MTGPLDKVFGISLRHQAVFFRQLATLVEAGVGVAKGLRTVAPQSCPALRGAIGEIVPRLDGGEPLSEALAAYPHLFSDFAVQMVRAGEKGGMLDSRMKDLALYLEKAYTFQQKMISQFIYPLVILHVAIFVPQIPTLVTGSVVGYLRATLGVLVPLYLAALGVFLFFRLAAQTSSLRLAVDAAAAGFPFIGGLFRTFALMRFFRSLSGLYEAGLSLAPALEAAARACGNAFMAKRLAASIPALDGGGGATAALRATRCVPVMALQMMEAAETAGSLGAALARIADYMEVEGEEALKRLATILPVFMYLLMGAYVGYTIVRFYVGYFNSIFTIMP